MTFDRQANQQHSFNKTVNDVEDKMRELEKAARAPELGNDLRGVKDLLKKQQVRSFVFAGQNSWTDEF